MSCAIVIEAVSDYCLGFLCKRPFKAIYTVLVSLYYSYQSLIMKLFFSCSGLSKESK